MEIFPNMGNEYRLFCCIALYVAAVVAVWAYPKSRFWWCIVGMTGGMVLNWLSYLLLGTDLYW